MPPSTQSGVRLYGGLYGGLYGVIKYGGRQAILNYGMSLSLDPCSVRVRSQYMPTSHCQPICSCQREVGWRCELGPCSALAGVLDPVKINTETTRDSMSLRQPRLEGRGRCCICPGGSRAKLANRDCVSARPYSVNNLFPLKKMFRESIWTLAHAQGRSCGLNLPLNDIGRCNKHQVL